MRTYLLPQEGQFYKANLHCHSTVSDGTLSPQELKEAYKAKGYSVLAITDHEWMQAHPELNDPDFLTITSYEMTLRDGVKTTPDNRIVHMNFYAKDPDCTEQIAYDPKWVVKYCHNLTEEQLNRQEPAAEPRVFGPEFVNRVVRKETKRAFWSVTIIRAGALRAMRTTFITMDSSLWKCIITPALWM